jgi:hypothetical protein
MVFTLELCNLATQIYRYYEKTIVYNVEEYLQRINYTTLIRKIFGVVNIQLNIRKIPVQCDTSNIYEKV